MSSPYYNIFIEKNEKDLTNFVTSIAHEDAVDVDTLVTLKMKDGIPDYLEDLDLQKGDNIIFQYGYIQGFTSPKYQARIVDLITKYHSVVTTRLIATDIGILIKKNQSMKVWEQVKVQDIVQEIADANGLTAIIDNSDTVHEFIPQAGRTDYEFLKYLATIETDGSYRFFLRGEKLFFTKRDLDKDSVRTFTYGDPNGEVLMFEPKDRETLKDQSSRNTTVTTVDPLTGEVTQEVVTNSNAADDTKLGDYVVHFNENGEEIATVKSAAQAQANDPDRAGKHIVLPTTSTGEAANIANKVKKDSALDDVQATLKTIGNPTYLADEIITMNGVAKKDGGNWYVRRVTHRISSSGYTTLFQLQKNALQKATTEDTAKASTVNSSVGAETAERKKELTTILFDGDANIVGTRTGS